MTIITITTDFGLRDGYVGVMKGVIWGICPDVKIVDITHLIPPQDVQQGGIALQRIVPYFPENTIHVAVVDPGVGTDRKPIAIKIGAKIFVGPDNGLFSRVIQSGLAAGKDVVSIELDKPNYWLSEISHVFHGRDIFAPVAAHLASGISFDEIGTPFSDPIILDLPEPNLLENKIIGEVISIDNFGNLATNIMDTHLKNYKGKLSIIVNEVKITDFVNTFGDRSSGSLVCMFGTQKDLIVACVNANASEMIKAGRGSKIEVYFE